MISSSESRYDMLILQPVCPSLHMTTYIQEAGEPPLTGKTQTIYTRTKHKLPRVGQEHKTDVQRKERGEAVRDV